MWNHSSGLWPAGSCVGTGAGQWAMSGKQTVHWVTRSVRSMDNPGWRLKQRERWTLQGGSRMSETERGGGRVCLSDMCVCLYSRENEKEKVHGGRQSQGKTAMDFFSNCRWYFVWSIFCWTTFRFYKSEIITHNYTSSQIFKDKYNIQYQNCSQNGDLACKVCNFFHSKRNKTLLWGQK